MVGLLGSGESHALSSRSQRDSWTDACRRLHRLLCPVCHSVIAASAAAAAAAAAASERSLLTLLTTRTTLHLRLC